MYHFVNLDRNNSTFDSSKHLDEIKLGDNMYVQQVIEAGKDIFERKKSVNPLRMKD